MQQLMGLQNDERNKSTEKLQSHKSNTINNNNVENPKDESELEIRTTRKIRELEEEVERRKMSESKLFESLESQTKKLEQTKIELEEYKLEVINLNMQIERLQNNDLNGTHTIQHFDSAKDAFNSLKYKLEKVKRDLASSQEAERATSLKTKSLSDEINVMRNELKLAISAEEQSRKAMEDLALALTEVATEANHTKGKLGSTELELEHVRAEAEQLKEMVRTTEDHYEKLLEEAKKEIERQKNIADRLSLEAEESVIAWNGKEKGFVECIRRAEEERARAQEEHVRLAQALSSSKDETAKVRDIMKQALNEANVAKVAASIARDENSQLKDCLAEKDETLHILAGENQRLISELQQLLSKLQGTDTSTDKKPSTAELENSDSQNNEETKSNSDSQNNEESKSKKAFSFDLKEIKVPIETTDEEKKTEIVVNDDDPQKAEALKGSIFDTTSSTPESEPHTPENAAVPQRRWSSPAFAEVSETQNTEELEQLENPCHDDGDGIDKYHHHRRRKSALLKRFGDMLYRKSAQKKEPATAE